ncbi:MAG: CaiB/BaiF CoA-transferase family protein [Spongiibacteraceae bacterium]
MAGPLEGLKVLDFSVLLPGPFGTQILADLGAEVLRVEAPGRGDMMRDLEPKAGTSSAAHASINRNKRSLTLDLKKPAALDIVHQLVADYDIVVEQFRPGVMTRLGLGYDALAKINPRLIYCSITGYGQTGRYKDRAGHDINYLALSGLASFSGRQDTGPVLSGTQIADVAGGSLHGVMGIMAAVIERYRTGKGQHVDVSMSDAALSLTAICGAEALASGVAPGFGSEMLNGGSFYDYYQTADGRYLSIGSLEPKFFTALFAVLGKPEWSQRMADQSVEAQQALKSDLQQLIGQKDFQHWSDTFAGLDACVEPVLDMNEVSESAHFNDRNMFVDVPCNTGETLRQIASPVKFSNSEARYDFAGVALGYHTDEVLTECGLSSEAITDLRNDGVIL